MSSSGIYLKAEVHVDAKMLAVNKSVILRVYNISATGNLLCGRFVHTHTSYTNVYMYTHTHTHTNTHTHTHTHIHMYIWYVYMVYMYV